MGKTVRSIGIRNDSIRLQTLLGGVLAIACGTMLAADFISARRISLPAVANIGFFLLGLSLLSSACADRDRSAAGEVLDSLRVAARRRRPLSEALDALRFEADPETRRIVRSLRCTWSDTGSLAGALDRHPTVFEAGIRHSVAVAERHGKVAEWLAGWQDDSRVRERHLRHWLLVAAYPLLLGVTVLVHRVLAHLSHRPEYLPDWELRWTASPGDQAVGHLPDALLLAFILVILSGSILFRYRRPFMGILARLPFAGPLCFLYAAADYARTAGGLIASGTPILPAHRAAMESQTIRFFRRRWEEISLRLADGLAYAEALERTRIPPHARTRLVVAAASKEPGAALLRAGTALAREADDALSRLIASAYPVTVVFYGVVVGTITYSLFAAIERCRDYHLTP